LRQHVAAFRAAVAEDAVVEQLGLFKWKLNFIDRKIEIQLRASAMTTLKVTLSLPDSLAVEALQAGLLSATGLERLVREALRTSRAERLVAARDKLGAEPLPPMTTEEIQAEVEAYRAQERRGAGT
jgi:hypothetical protein